MMSFLSIQMYYELTVLSMKPMPTRTHSYGEKILSDIGKDSGRSVMILSKESISSLRNRISTADTPFLESLILIIY